MKISTHLLLFACTIFCRFPSSNVGSTCRYRRRGSIICEHASIPNDHIIARISLYFATLIYPRHRIASAATTLDGDNVYDRQYNAFCGTFVRLLLCRQQGPTMMYNKMTSAFSFVWRQPISVTSFILIHSPLPNAIAFSFTIETISLFLRFWNAWTEYRCRGTPPKMPTCMLTR